MKCWKLLHKFKEWKKMNRNKTDGSLCSQEKGHIINVEEKVDSKEDSIAIVENKDETDGSLQEHIEDTEGQTIRTKETDLGTKENGHGTKETDLGTKEKDFGTKETDLRTKEKDLGTKETDLGTKEKDLPSSEPLIIHSEEEKVDVKISDALKKMQPNKLDYKMSFYHSLQPHLDDFNRNEWLYFQTEVVRIITTIKYKMISAPHRHGYLKYSTSRSNKQSSLTPLRRTQAFPSVFTQTPKIEENHSSVTILSTPSRGSSTVNSYKTSSYDDSKKTPEVSFEKTFPANLPRQNRTSIAVLLPSFSSQPLLLSQIKSETDKIKKAPSVDNLSQSDDKKESSHEPSTSYKSQMIPTASTRIPFISSSPTSRNRPLLPLLVSSTPKLSLLPRHDNVRKTSTETSSENFAEGNDEKNSERRSATVEEFIGKSESFIDSLNPDVISAEDAVYSKQSINNYSAGRIHVKDESPEFSYTDESDDNYSPSSESARVTSVSESVASTVKDLKRKPEDNEQLPPTNSLVNITVKPHCYVAETDKAHCFVAERDKSHCSVADPNNQRNYTVNEIAYTYDLQFAAYIASALNQIRNKRRKLQTKHNILNLLMQAEFRDLVD